MGNALDAAQIVPASCVSMVTARVVPAVRCGGIFQITLKVSKRSYNLQQWSVLTHLTPPYFGVCVWAWVCEEQHNSSRDAFPLLYGHGWAPLEWWRLVIVHLHTEYRQACNTPTCLFPDMNARSHKWLSMTIYWGVFVNDSCDECSIDCSLTPTCHRCIDHDIHIALAWSINARL